MGLAGWHLNLDLKFYYVVIRVLFANIPNHLFKNLELKKENWKNST